MRRLVPLLFLLVPLPGCVVDADWEDFALDRAPFANAWVDRDDAEFEVLLADGYACPDGRGARVYLIEPTTPASPESPRPVALLLHDGPFAVRAEESVAPDEDPLAAAWSATAVEAALGMESALRSGGLGEGAWAAALLARGFAIVAPANCFGDLWQGRGDNPTDEGFLRLGGYLLDDAVALAAARPHLSAEEILVVGLGDGGRGVTQLALADAPVGGAVVDGSPDWLAPFVAQPTTHAARIEILLALYDAEVGGIADATARLAALRVALERDSLVHAVRDLGFRAPIVYAYSTLDPRVEVALTQPAADAIATSYPPGEALVLEWGVADHAPSNRDFAEASERLDWLLERMGLLPP